MERDNLLVDGVATPVLIHVSPEEVTAHFVYLVANFFWEKHGLHGIKRDRGYQSFDEGSFSSHRKIPSLPSFDSLTVITLIFNGRDEMDWS